MKQIIENFPFQFLADLKIVNQEKIKRKFKKFVLGGMGGSHLAADLLKVWQPEIDLMIYNNYHLPLINQKEKRERFFIASSFSGNTEETLDFFHQALKNNLSLGVITSGGKLLNLAKKNKIPYIFLPDKTIPPRLALGYSFKALTLFVQPKALKKVENLAYLLKPKKFEKEGKLLAKKLIGFIPVIYSSFENFGLAYQWKIEFNETAKIPAFSNFFPELNHNEMAGFVDLVSKNQLTKYFYFLLLYDQEDHFKIKKRMKLLMKIFLKNLIPIQLIKINRQKDKLENIFSSVLLSYWTSYYLALSGGKSPLSLDVIEDFKKRL